MAQKIRPYLQRPPSRALAVAFGAFVAHLRPRREIPRSRVCTKHTNGAEFASAAGRTRAGPLKISQLQLSEQRLRRVL
ncbi:hypothetical protein EVAR_26394_1 [Eumeta japonica]|uniref:Uncharacterized protein n=1 Tax=Eumeta variegata TaxID=151549 RepID=A0A4C1VPZ4_EUMVA|nr:hypothetical protein EVAR_26394_1 [Eumeta japonica]